MIGKSALVNEIIFSIQGESSRAGIPTVFVRLTGCNLRCGYCDTSYAWDEGGQMDIDSIIERVNSFNCKTVEITGGEPMEQASTPELANRLAERGFTVMIETNGSVDLSPLPEGIIKIVDVKCPESGAGDSFLYANLRLITPDDELKFVVSSKNDFNWALKEIETRNLLSLCRINVTPAAGRVEPADVAGWILESGKNLRLNLQIHKILWGDVRGV
ncbi:MAG: 7-carboxy-7-deazaguanine synthase [bacterium]|nr:MAG: 7-carboxy-7-deazaguanine synthase [bacterium]